MVTEREYFKLRYQKSSGLDSKKFLSILTLIKSPMVAATRKKSTIIIILLH